MPLIGSILLATLVVSSISLVGILFTGLKESPPDRLLEYFVSFAAGGLLGGAFLHLLPEADGAPGFSSAGWKRGQGLPEVVRVGDPGTTIVRLPASIPRNTGTVPPRSSKIVSCPQFHLVVVRLFTVFAVSISSEDGSFEPEVEILYAGIQELRRQGEAFIVHIENTYDGRCKI